VRGRVRVIDDTHGRGAGERVDEYFAGSKDVFHRIRRAGLHIGGRTDVNRSAQN
jgi:hypothetical protein